jgi:DNA-binding response OmpR family regulator
MAKGLRILAIDNEPSVTTSLEWVFGPPRYQVNKVASGEAALAAVDGAAEPFDVIIVDQKMPNLTGTELVTAFRERGVQSRIIVLSANITDEVRQTYEELGVQAIFEKPPDIMQLRAAVEVHPVA